MYFLSFCLLFENTHLADRAFEEVRDNLLKEVKRSFIRRYLRRRDTREDLGGCDIALTNALTLFSVSIARLICFTVNLLSFAIAQSPNPFYATAQRS